MKKERDLEPEEMTEDVTDVPQDEAIERAGTEPADAKVVSEAAAAGQEETEQEKTAKELAALRQEMDEAKAKEAEYLDGWQRARAELANARKRFQREQEQAYTNARADVLTRVLPIRDDFERAVDTLSEDLSNSHWVNGVLLIWRKLELLLDQSGVVPIEAVGQEFDPVQHQAVTHEPSETVPEGHVIDEMQKGYRIGDRVLRPSMVRVSSGPPKVEVEETDVEAETEPAD